MILLAACFILIHVHLLHASSHAETIAPAPLHPPCELTLGGWCQAYQEQQPQPTRMPPQGSKACPGRCSGVGTCDADTGTCVCPAGWTGPDCSGKRQRAVGDQDTGWGALSFKVPHFTLTIQQLGFFRSLCDGSRILFTPP